MISCERNLIGEWMMWTFLANKLLKSHGIWVETSQSVKFMNNEFLNKEYAPKSKGMKEWVWNWKRWKAIETT